MEVSALVRRQRAYRGCGAERKGRILQVRGNRLNACGIPAGRLRGSWVCAVSLPLIFRLGGVIDLIAAGEIPGRMAKNLFGILRTDGRDPAEVAAARGMKQVTDTGAIEAAVDEIIAANPAQVEKARANPKHAGWFTGQVIKATGGKANPATVGAMVAAKLGL